MVFQYFFAEKGAVDVGIDFRSRNVFVSEHFLYGSVAAGLSFDRKLDKPA